MNLELVQVKQQKNHGIIDHPSPHVNKAIEWMKEKCPWYRNDKVSSTDGKCKSRDIRLAFYDLETGRF